MLALLMLVGLAAVGFAGVVAWGLSMTVWIAVAALALSALLVVAALKIREAWQAARWDAGQRVR